MVAVRVLTALPKSLTQGRLVKVLADEDHLVDAWLVLFPVFGRRAEVDRLVHALEDKLGATLTVDREHTFAAVQITRALAKKRAHKVVKLDV